jgi:tetratricopeptide (TPR) repeat protein
VNNPNPCDHFGYRSHADFFGAHYLDGRCGTYHVAPRIEAPGQKYFTWGTRDDNKIWEGYLTDADGQYVEIQSGILETQWFTGWLDPVQTIRTEGSWFGVSDCPELTWANARLGVAAQEGEGCVALAVHSVDLAEETTVVIRRGETTQEFSARLRPGQAVALPAQDASPFGLEVRDRRGRLLLAESWDGAGSRGLAAARSLEPPVQWGMRGRSQPARRAVESEIKYHRWAKAEGVLAKHAAEISDLDASRLRAEMALKTADWDAAWRLARSVLEYDPEDHAAHALAMVAALGRLRAGDATAYGEVYDHVLVVRNNARFSAAASLALGEAALLVGRPLDAVLALERALAQAPESREAKALLAAARRACGEDVDVSVLAQRALAGCEANPTLATEQFLELAFVWWRAGHMDCVAEVLPLAPDPDHPAVRLLNGESGEGLDLAGTVLSRWEEAALLRRALEHDGEQLHWQYLLAVWEAENHRVEQAMARFAKVAAGESAARWLACSVLADYAAHVANRPEEAIAHLATALAERPEDHRLLCRQDDLLRQLQDVSRRSAQWASVSVALRQRGDIVFRLARLALDQGRGAEAAAMLLAQRFSVYEGGTSIRRLYVDARLVAALDALQAQDWAAAEAHCRAVLEYPKNLGAASYLGEHSRLARFLLGEFARRAGREDEARTWWRDVLARSGGTVAYTVGGEDAASKLRDDERLAVWLSGDRLGENPDAPAVVPPTKTPQGEGAFRSAMVACIRSGQRRADWEDEALAEYPCSPLLRILVGMSRALAVPSV